MFCLLTKESVHKHKLFKHSGFRIWQSKNDRHCSLHFPLFLQTILMCWAAQWSTKCCPTDFMKWLSTPWKDGSCQSYEPQKGRQGKLLRKLSQLRRETSGCSQLLKGSARNFKKEATGQWRHLKNKDAFPGDVLADLDLVSLQVQGDDGHCWLSSRSLDKAFWLLKWAVGWGVGRGDVPFRML